MRYFKRFSNRIGRLSYFSPCGQRCSPLSRYLALKSVSFFYLIISPAEKYQTTRICNPSSPAALCVTNSEFLATDEDDDNDGDQASIKCANLPTEFWARQGPLEPTRPLEPLHHSSPCPLELFQTPLELLQTPLELLQKLRIWQGYHWGMMMMMMTTWLQYLLCGSHGLSARRAWRTK